MRIMLLLLPALLLSSCAQTQNPPSLPSQSRPLPEVLTNPPSASAEGTSTESLRVLNWNMQRDLELSLQKFHSEMLQELRMSLETLKASPPPSAPVAPTR